MQGFYVKLPFAKASQVRTDALNSLILGVSMFLSNEGASKVLSLLGVKVSNDTIQRLYDRIDFVDNPDVEAVGIDDVAIRKGQTYATAIYDLKDHHLIALLEGRDAQSLKEWLKKHQKIRLVARDRASAYASAINVVLPDCMQVADRFHLLQNLLEHLKEIFKEEMPSSIYIKDGRKLEQPPEKIPREKEPDRAYLATQHYDNTPPENSDGSIQTYDNKYHNLSQKQYKEQAENRKKQEMILVLQQFWNRLKKKKIKTVAEHFQISLPTAKRYIYMSVSEIEGLNLPNNYKKRESPMNKWLNVIFKMMRDGHGNETIYFYI